MIVKAHEYCASFETPFIELDSIRHIPCLYGASFNLILISSPVAYNTSEALV